MTRLDWASAPRRYEAGVDHGVLYPPSGPGVPWNGLVTVEESHTGGDMDAYYFDGIKYLEKQNPKNYQATITAFSAPKEFSQCVGQLPVIPGFILTRQPRKQFGFSYRTLIEDGDDYKIHIVYNATATPESRGYATIDGSAFATSFSWKIDAVPPKVNGFRPSAHFTLDTTKTDLFTLRAIEDILYGTATSEPRLPSVEELVDIVGLWDPRLIVPATFEETINLALNPDAVGTGLVSHWTNLGSTAHTRAYDNEFGYESISSVKFTMTADGPLGGKAHTTEVLIPGDVIRWSMWVYATRTLIWRPYWERLGGTYKGGTGGPDRSIPANEWVLITGETTITTNNATEPGTTVYHGLGAYSPVAAPNGWVAGDIFWVDRAVITKNQPLPSYFSGDTPDDVDFDYVWLEDPNNSKSVRSTKVVSYLTPGLGDLTPSKTLGIYRDLPTTRLVETPTRVIPGEVVSEIVNLVPNPSHETDPSTSGWSLANATAVAATSRSRAGSRSMALTAVAAGNISASRRDTLVEVGKTYTMLTSLGASDPGITIRLDYAFERADNSRIGSYTVLTQTVAPTSGLVDISETLPPVPDETHHVFFVIAALNPGVGKTIYIDASALIEGVDQPYFDGDTEPTMLYDYAWTGTPHASTSVRRTMRQDNLGLYRLE